MQIKDMSLSIHENWHYGNKAHQPDTVVVFKDETDTVNVVNACGGVVDVTNGDDDKLPRKP